MSRCFPVYLPSLVRRQDSAERVVLPEAPRFLGIVEQDGTDLRPRTAENLQPLPSRNVAALDPARADAAGPGEPFAARIGVDLRHDAARHCQASPVDCLMVFHGSILFPLEEPAVDKRLRTPGT